MSSSRGSPLAGPVHTHDEGDEDEHFEHHHHHHHHYDDNDDDDDEDDEDEDYVPHHHRHHDDDDQDEEDIEDDDEADMPLGDIQFELIIEEIGLDMAGNGDGSASDNDHDADAHLSQGPGGGPRTRVRINTIRPGHPFLTQRQFLAWYRGQYLNPTIVDDEDGQGQHFTWEIGDGGRGKQFPKVPSDEGRKLMESGAFGSFDWRTPNRLTVARRLLDRELGLKGPIGQKINQGLMAQSMIPSTKPDMVIYYDDPVCCGQFSDDGNFFYACVKDFKVRLYDTSSPYNWKHYKTFTYPYGQWTMTDAALSPDNRWLAFSSLQPHVGMAPTDPNDTGDPYSLDLSDARPSRNEYLFGGFAIFSVRFSGDGRNLVAGTGLHSIIVYDIERRETLHHVEGHSDDVNAVCFADRMSPHILYSGSDDCTIKVWDTRSLGDGREAGAFVGHTEGLTYIDSKGDGRYILSNGKDQSMKLWDLRMAMSTSRFRELDPTAVTRNRDYEYDYRWQDYEDYQWFQHPHDNSLVTFRGHKVQRTLIRCHFSPPGSSDSRYVYSGSHDGKVYIWNLDATLAAKIDVKEATRAAAGWPRDGMRHRLHHRHSGRNVWEALVRDVGWHPNAPMLVASSWGGLGQDCGTASLHSFNVGDDDEGEPAMGIMVNERLRAL